MTLLTWIPKPLMVHIQADGSYLASYLITECISPHPTNIWRSDHERFLTYMKSKCGISHTKSMIFYSQRITYATRLEEIPVDGGVYFKLLGITCELFSIRSNEYPYFYTSFQNSWYITLNHWNSNSNIRHVLVF